jgi:hypothetical protein
MEDQMQQRLQSENEVSAQPKDADKALNKLSVRSQKIWQNFDSEASEILAKNFADQNLYPPDNAHVRTLKWLSENQTDHRSHPKTLSEVLRNYNEFMDREIHENRLKAADVLRPAFVFKMPNGRIIWRKFGEEIPKGAIFQDYQYRDQREIDAMFQKLILNRVFPVGYTSLIAGGERRTAFEHDLGHLTGFIEYPQYMVSLLKLYRDMPKHPEFLSKLDKRTPYGPSVFQKRIYFYVEAMTVVNPATKNLMLKSLVLSDSMRNRMDEVSVDEMTQYLKTIPADQLISRFSKILLEADSWFTPYGGAARNSGERDAEFHNRFVGLLRKGFYPKTLAEFQVTAIRLRDVTAQDWFDQAFVEYIPTHSKLHAYFSAFRRGTGSDPFAAQPH